MTWRWPFFVPRKDERSPEVRINSYRNRRIYFWPGWTALVMVTLWGALSWQFGFGKASYACLALYWLGTFWTPGWLEVADQTLTIRNGLRSRTVRLSRIQRVCLDSTGYRLSAEAEAPSETVVISAEFSGMMGFTRSLGRRGDIAAAIALAAGIPVGPQVTGGEHLQAKIAARPRKDKTPLLSFQR